MKKIFTLIAAAFVAVAAHAQFYAGGTASFQSGDSGYISIAPEAAYSFNDEFAAGAIVGFRHHNESYDVLSLNPYVRWTFGEWAPLKLFLDAGISFDSVSLDKKAWGEAKTYSALQVGVKPGIALPLNDDLKFVAHLGFVGFSAADDALQNAFGYDDGVGAHFSGNNLAIGIFYCF
ncbi:MAG: hypothetical protein J5632_01720 [Bacteroidales bacterium]|nr:hypothetical protein [Bacteroidales bacterium]